MSVAYASLQKFAGATAGVPVGDELDEAWNPRNKALADAKFKADIERHGCQDESAIAITWVCPPTNILLIESNEELAGY